MLSMDSHSWTHVLVSAATSLPSLTSSHQEFGGGTFIIACWSRVIKGPEVQTSPHSEPSIEVHSSARLSSAAPTSTRLAVLQSISW
ncbi:hypothetical protein CCH79_00003214 [Gambusia affinis]|uniref:Uncharacterized protein n=1 Tax=Gambusia affinis TaxID=33528 RepID=A0A315VQ00_GAMAF|nr:hypothetical protein CCH79_00003214 [Gambusia affinis]